MRGLVTVNPFQVTKGGIDVLTEDELQRLDIAFDTWVERSPNQHVRKKRERIRLFYKFLKSTGARISELNQVDDMRDINFKTLEIKMPILKRRTRIYKTLPLGGQLVSELLLFLRQHKDMEGKAFKVSRTNFFIAFRARCKEAGIPERLAHPHILRHTRATQLIRNGVPITVVQKLLGHYSLSNTAVYIQFTATEVRDILQSRNLL